MGKIKAHEIVFEGDDPFEFDAGSNLKGHVFLKLSEPLNVRGITILIRGKGKVEWSESQGNDEKPIVYRATDDYLKSDILLHGIRSDWGNTTVGLTAGEHKFPFDFPLPSNLPSSFEGRLGFVRYHVKSNIDILWQRDPKAKLTFKVRSVSDLNLEPKNREEITDAKVKHLGCLCCKSGPVLAAFKLEQQGFVPGEGIKIFAEIINNSSRKISKSYVNLKRTALFIVSGKFKKQTMEIARVTRPAIEPHGKDVWDGQTLIVPPTPPSGFPGCRMIDMFYVLQLNVDPAGLSLDLEIPLLINIGSIPLRPLSALEKSAESEESDNHVALPGTAQD